MEPKSGQTSFVSKLFNKETVLYVVFGVLTTLVNYVAFYFFNKGLSGYDLSKSAFLSFLFLGRPYLLSNAIAWIIAVAFAFITNKLFVFESKSREPKILLRELSTFFGARIFSLIAEQLGLILLIDIMTMGDLLSKLIMSVVVVMLNYFFSKLIIFKNKA